MKNLLLIITIILFASCGGKKESLQGETEFQRAMNASFKDASKSPLSNKDRKSFMGLDFFAVDSSYVVLAQLKSTPDSEYFNMKTTTERISKERVYGVLTFELNGTSIQLNVYQGEESLETPGKEDYLFLPFLDDTNGDSTYGGGRYIDLKIPLGNEITIDFNNSYNPLCVYNENYSCPIVPRINYIDLAINAGMKNYNKN